MYGVETRRLNEQVRRNFSNFPEDFMFQLSEEESQNFKSQIAASSRGCKRKHSYRQLLKKLSEFEIVKMVELTLNLLTKWGNSIFLKEHSALKGRS